MAEENNPIEGIALSMRQLAAGFGGRDLKEGASSGVAIAELAKEIAEQNKIAQDKKTDEERNQLLMDLVTSTERGDKEGEQNSLELRSRFIESQERLQAAIESGNQNQIDLETANQESILASAETEEQRREAAKMADKQSGLLGKISNGIGGLTGFLKDNAVAVGGGLLAGLALFAPELMEKLVGRFVEVLSTAFEIVKKLLDGDVNGALEAFGTEWKAFTGAFIFFFGGKIIKGLKAAHAAFKGIMTAVQTYKMFLATNYAGSMMAHLKDMMKNLGNTLMKPLRLLLNGARVFRVFMMTSFIPGMIAAFSGMIAAITPMLVALAPILLPILAIAAVFGLIYLALEKMREAMGFTSIFDVMLLGLAYLKDGFGHIVNLIGTIVNFIMGLVGKFASFLGFDIDIPKIPKMNTDNAKKKKAELQEKAAAAAEEEAAKKAKQDIDADPLTYEVDITEPELSTSTIDSSESITPDSTSSRGRGRRRGRASVSKNQPIAGDQLNIESTENNMMQEKAQTNSPTNVVVQNKGGDVTNNSTTNQTRNYRRRRGWRSNDTDTAAAF